MTGRDQLIQAMDVAFDRGLAPVAIICLDPETSMPTFAIPATLAGSPICERLLEMLNDLRAADVVREAIDAI